MNFYRMIFETHSKVTLPLTELLMKADQPAEPREGGPRSLKSYNCGKVEWEWTREAELAFQKLKRTIDQAPILQHFEAGRPIILQMDPTGSSIAGSLNEYGGFGVLGLVNCFRQKCTSEDLNYSTYDGQLLAIVDTLKQWRHYLQGANHKVLSWCDHMHVEFLQTSNVLSQKQARLSGTLSAYDFGIDHLQDSKDPINCPSEQLDCEIGHRRPAAQLMATDSQEPHDELIQRIIAAPSSHPLAVNVSAMLVERPMIDGTDFTTEVSHWKVVMRALSDEGRIHIRVVDSSCRNVICLFHDNHESGHFGALRTTEVLSRDLYWPVMDSDGRKYVSGCDYATESQHLGTPGTGSTCLWGNHHGHGKASQSTWSLTSHSHWNWAAPGSSVS